MSRQRTRPAQLTTDATQAHAVSQEDLLDRDVRFDLLEANPRRRHHVFLASLETLMLRDSPSRRRTAPAHKQTGARRE
jgi:hypothetical protein